MLAVHVDAAVPLVVVEAIDAVARVAVLRAHAAVHAEHHAAVAHARRALTRQVVVNPALVTLALERLC